jgi:pentose-5-phosphate-3-epimerase
MKYSISILNPKAKKLLEDLADLKLITFQKETDISLKKLVSQSKKRGFKKFLAIEEIQTEVDKVRSERYAKKTSFLNSRV